MIDNTRESAKATGGRAIGHGEVVGISTRFRVLAFCLVWCVIASTGLLFAAKSNHDQRVEDLSAIRAALESYKSDNGSYPKTPGVSIADASNPPVKAWIPGLAPRYMRVVPRDPRRLSIPSRQYLYISDGDNYKIIAHGAEDIGIAARQRPDMIDPRRPDYAYGFWSAGAASW